MTPSASVIVPVSGGGRPMLRTTDSVAHQGNVELLLVGPDATPLVDSVTARLGATLIAKDGSPGASLNEAVRRAATDVILIVPCGYTLPRGFAERCVWALRPDGSITGLAPRVTLHTADGRAKMDWIPEGLTAAAALSDPGSVPPVLGVRRTAWDALGGFDETLPGLTEYEFWLRLLLGGHEVRPLPAPGVGRELTEAGANAGDPGHLAALRLVLTKHAHSIERELQTVLVSREVHFGRLREIHRTLLAERDAGLAELDRVRAETANHVAYLDHHGLAAFDWGELRRTDPVSRDWGYDRGVPIDRCYIAAFLESHSSDIKGAVLEVQEDDLTRRLGGLRVTTSDVLDIDAGNVRATILSDLRCAPGIADDRFDCIILTQTLHVIDDMRAALGECYRMLKPGGVLLATLPAASRVCLEYGEEGDLWRVTPAGARALVETVFAPADVSIDVFGNVLTNVAFLTGLACGDLSGDEFVPADPYHPALTGVRASKPRASSRRPIRADDHARGAVLLYHRIDEADDVHGLNVAPASFDSHLHWMRQTCAIVSLDEMLSSPADDLPDRAVAITFDDGYLDNLETAASLLQRHGAPATFFLTTRWLDAPGEYWWDALERILLGPAPVPSTLEVFVRHRVRRLPAGSGDERRAAHRVLHDALVHAGLAERDRLMETVLRWSGGGRPRYRPMVADEIRTLASLPGVAIGAHTVDHLALPDQPSDVRLRQLLESQASLARLVERPIAGLAYPYGAYDRDSLALVRESSRWGLTCDDPALGRSFDAARVPRLDVKQWDAAAFGSRVESMFKVSAPPLPRASTPGRSAPPPRPASASRFV